MLPSKRKMKVLSAAKLRSLVCYDPATGLFTWMARADDAWFTSRYAGQIAGGNNPATRYWSIQIEGESYLAHRLAWLYMTGKWPTDQIDHRDRDPTNNRWSNLREADCQLNCTNRGLNTRNTSGVSGVAWDKKYEKWRAGIYHKGVNYPLGFFDNKDDAIAARQAKQTELWKLAKE